MESPCPLNSSIFLVRLQSEQTLVCGSSNFGDILSIPNMIICAIIISNNVIRRNFILHLNKSIYRINRSINAIVLWGGQNIDFNNSYFRF